MCHVEPLGVTKPMSLSKFWGSSGMASVARKGGLQALQALVRVPLLSDRGVTVHPLHCSLRRS